MYERKVKWERVFLLGIIVYLFVGTVCSIIDSHIDPYKFEKRYTGRNILEF